MTVLPSAPLDGPSCARLGRLVSQLRRQSAGEGVAWCVSRLAAVAPDMPPWVATVVVVTSLASLLATTATAAAAADTGIYGK